MKQLKQNGIADENAKGVIELYKNNKRIRCFNFSNRTQRRKYIKRLIEYSNIDLNNYHFIVKLNVDELF